MKSNQTEFTRRIPAVAKKYHERAYKMVTKLHQAWDLEKDAEKVKRIFFKDAKLLSNPHYWEILRTIWVIAGNSDNVKEFLPFFTSKRPCKSWFMTPEDENTLNNIKFPLTVYRAYRTEPDQGISWSSDLEFVKRFAGKSRKIKKRSINRQDVFAYISRRHEHEFIILNDQHTPV